MYLRWRWLLIPLMVSLCAACASQQKGATPGPAGAKGEGTKKGPPASAHWSDADSEIVAKELVASLLKSSGLKAYRAKLGRAPLFHVATLRNRTSRMLDARGITKILVSQLAKKGLSVVSATSTKKADLALTGFIYGLSDNKGGRFLRTTMVRLDAIRVATSEKVWVGRSLVRKLVEYSASPWPDKNKPAKPRKPAKPPTATYLAHDAELALSGALNDLDLRRAARAAAKAASRSWLSRPGKPPVLKFYPIRNRTSQHVQFGLFTTELEVALLASGKVRVVAAPDQTQTLRALRVKDASLPSEVGAEQIINGWLTERREGKKVRYVLSLGATKVSSDQKVFVFTHTMDKTLSAAARPVF